MKSINKLIFVFLVLTLLSFKVFAISSDSALHITAHFGGVYALTDISGTLCDKLTKGEHKTGCIVTGMAIGNIANFAYKANQQFPNDTKRALISGGLGSVFAATMLRIEF
jgi:hypothetical protein